MLNTADEEPETAGQLHALRCLSSQAKCLLPVLTERKN